MRNLRRFLSMLASVAMLISMLSIATAADNPVATVSEKTICVGDGFTATLKSDGSIWIWGTTIITSNGNNPILIEKPYKLVDSGARTMFTSESGNLYYIKVDNVLWGCGPNFKGQVGVPGQDVYNFPVKIMENVLDGDAGNEFVGVVSLDHCYYTWGSNSFGQLGTNGTGNLRYGVTTCQNVPLKVLDNVRSNSAAGASAAVVTLDSKLLTCGLNDMGQLANGKSNDWGVPNQETVFETTFKVVTYNVKKANIGALNIGVIKNDNTGWVCGYNRNYQLGFGEKDANGIMNPMVVATLTQIANSVFDIIPGNTNIYVLKLDSTLWGTGSNINGQMGIGYEGQTLKEGKIDPQYVSKLTYITDKVVCADTDDSTVLVLKFDGTCFGWGGNLSGQLMDKHNISLSGYNRFCQTFPVPIMTGVKLPSNSLRQAKPNPSAVMLDGNSVNMNMYTIYSETGGGTNLVKLRDVAYLLSNTQANFEVSWDQKTSTISITTGKAYTAVGGEMQAGTAGDKIAVPTSSKILVDGQEVNLTGYTIGANNYFALRDLGQALGFNVTWDGKVVIESDKPYQG